MTLQPGLLYHIYNRGNNRQRIFFSRENYLYFLTKVRKYLTPNLRIIAWCLMPNHFHLLVQVREEANPASCGAGFRTLLSSYTRAIQRQENMTGSLFQQQTQAKNLTDGDLNYAGICFCYIHQNPLRAGLVSDLRDWPWSSFVDYAGLRAGTLCDLKAAKEQLDLPADTQEIIDWILQTMPEEVPVKLY